MERAALYPNLAHQTIILATSDDLADGLYEELAETGAVGRAVEIREASANRVQVVEANLATFFEVTDVIKGAVDLLSGQLTSDR